MLCLYYWGITVGKSVVLHTLVKYVAVVEADCSVLFNIITLSSLTSYTCCFFSFPLLIIVCYAAMFVFKGKKMLRIDKKLAFKAM